MTPSPGLWIGIDVSARWLDIAEGPGAKPYRRAYCAEALQHDIARWATMPLGGIVCESSGVYHERLARLLQAANLPISIVNPQKVVAYRTATTGRAKTDPLDAQLLASFGTWCQPTPLPRRSSTMWDLRELVATRDSTVHEVSRTTCQRHQRVVGIVDELLDTRRAFLRAQVARLDQEITRIIAADPDLARRRRILQSMPGIGPVLSAVLVTFMPELGTMTKREVASLAGLAPHPRDSGTRSGYRMVTGGRRTVATAMYLAATRFGNDPVLSARKAHLRTSGNGKKPKVVTVALARWMMTVLNTMVRENLEWSELRLQQEAVTTT